MFAHQVAVAERPADFPDLPRGLPFIFDLQFCFIFAAAAGCSDPRAAGAVSDMDVSANVFEAMSVG